MTLSAFGVEHPDQFGKAVSWEGTKAAIGSVEDFKAGRKAANIPSVGAEMGSVLRPKAPTSALGRTGKLVQSGINSAKPAVNTAVNAVKANPKVAAGVAGGTGLALGIGLAHHNNNLNKAAGRHSGKPTSTSPNGIPQQGRNPYMAQHTPGSPHMPAPTPAPQIVNHYTMTSPVAEAEKTAAKLTEGGKAVKGLSGMQMAGVGAGVLGAGVLGGALARHRENEKKGLSKNLRAKLDRITPDVEGSPRASGARMVPKKSTRRMDLTKAYGYDPEENRHRRDGAKVAVAGAGALAGAGYAGHHGMKAYNAAKDGKASREAMLGHLKTATAAAPNKKAPTMVGVGRLKEVTAAVERGAESSKTFSHHATRAGGGALASGALAAGALAMHRRNQRRGHSYSGYYV